MMKGKLLGLLAAGALAWLPTAGAANLVTWNFSGTWTAVQGAAQPGFDPLPSSGTQFRVSLTFDSAAARLFDCGVDGVDDCAGYSPAGMSFSLLSPSCPGGICSSGSPSTTITAYSQILVLNNFNLVTGGDGLAFRLYDVNGNFWRLFLDAQGTDVFNSTSLSGNFDQRLLFSNQFTLCDPASGPPTNASCGTDWTTRVDGFRTLAFVPEPGSLALLGVGLVGLGLSRRRKAA